MCMPLLTIKLLLTLHALDYWLYACTGAANTLRVEQSSSTAHVIVCSMHGITIHLAVCARCISDVPLNT